MNLLQFQSGQPSLSHGLALRGPVGNGFENDPGDVLAVKRRLHGLGLYDEPPYGFTGFIDRATSDGIVKFQAANGLKPDGWLDRGGETEAALNAADYQAGDDVLIGAAGDDTLTAPEPPTRGVNLLDEAEARSQAASAPAHRSFNPGREAAKRIASSSPDKPTDEGGPAQTYRPMAEQFLNDEGYYRGNVLPFRENLETEELELALPKFVVAPAQAWMRMMDAVREGRKADPTDVFEVAGAITGSGIATRGGSLNMGLRRPPKNPKRAAEIAGELEKRPPEDVLLEQIKKKVPNPHGMRGDDATKDGLDIAIQEVKVLMERRHPEYAPHFEHLGGGRAGGTARGEPVPELRIWNPKIVTAREVAKEKKIPVVMPKLGHNERQWVQPDLYFALTLRNAFGALYLNAQRMNKSGSSPVKGERTSMANMIEFVTDGIVVGFPKMTKDMDPEAYRALVSRHLEDALDKVIVYVGIDPNVI